MLRRLLTIVLPIVAPFIAWWLYLRYARWRARHGQRPDPPGWTQAPWEAILLAVIVLMAASLLWFHADRGKAPWSRYRAPFLEDGTIVPPHVEESAAD